MSIKIICFVIIIFSLLSCGTKKNYQKTTFMVNNIDSTQNWYLINSTLINDNKNFIILSPKLNTTINKCKQITIDSEYSNQLIFESYTHENNGGYTIDGIVFPTETTFAFSKKIKGLCLK